jgi:hypothetical protein
MPITLTLTDDQALEVTAQLSKLLAAKTRDTQPEQKPASDVCDHTKLVNALETFPVGKPFRVIEVALKAGLETRYVSGRFHMRQAELGVVALRRGTWKRVV